MLNYIIYTVLLVNILSCTTVRNKNSIKYGSQLEYRAFVPASIAIMQVQRLPKTIPFKEIKYQNINQLDVKILSTKFDKFVLNGFTNQPLMRGYSSKYSSNAMKKVALKNISFSAIWADYGVDCQSCDDFLTYYNLKLKKHQDWQVWLTKVSQAVKDVDAILLPIITSMTQEKKSQQGILVATRSVAVELFLVNTINGQVIWSQKNTAMVANKSLLKKGEEQLEYPNWDVLAQRVLNDQLWLEFPGRQNQ